MIDYRERLHRGFGKLDQDLDFLLGLLRETLEAAGDGAAGRLPWSGVEGEELTRADVHAHTVAFQLLNLVEENAAAQIRRLIETENGLGAESGLWTQTLEALAKAGWSPDEIAMRLPYVRVEPVLTAHPTEARRVTVTEHVRALYLLLVQRENSMWAPAEREHLRREMLCAIELLWRTGQTLIEKPTVSDERAAIMHYLARVFPETVNRLDRRLEAAWEQMGWDAGLIDDPAVLPRLRFGSWVGGDRDGHPFVSPQVTRETLLDLRSHALELHDDGLKRLARALSLSESQVTVPRTLRDGIQTLTDRLGEEARVILARNPGEPWRQYVSMMRACVPAVNPAGFNVEGIRHYRRASELAADLRVLRRALCDVGAGVIARMEVDPVLRCCEVFGFHLAALDIRQNSGFHDRAIEQILGAKAVGYASWSEERRCALLDAELRRAAPLSAGAADAGTEAAAAVGAYEAVADALRQFGHEAIGSLVLSMTRGLSDLLGVYFLAREAGLLRPGETAPHCLVPVTPLFETLNDLDHAPQIMGRFLEHPVTQSSLGEMHRQRALMAKKGAKRVADPDDVGPGALLTIGRKPVQQVMIGYSDSNKDSGILASQFGLYRAQRAITETALGRGVRIRFFHGRGGTISRGAGPTHRFLEALPSGTLHYDLRMTDQGESIDQRYTNLITATYNLELLLAGAARVSLLNDRPDMPSHPLEGVFARVAAESRVAYRALVEHPGFVEYHRQATPIEVLENARIGSRPVRRTGAQTLEDLRAIPWVFSWSQSRVFLTGWYGAGQGLARLQRETPEDFERLADGMSGWAFLRYVFTNVETSLASVDFAVVEDYAALVDDDRLREHFLGALKDEHRLAVQAVADLFRSPLGERRPRLERTLRRRAEALRPLHRHQAALLRQWRRAREEGDDGRAESLLGELLLCVNAIASGLKTTG